MKSDLHWLLYVSTAAPSIESGGVGAIARQARAKNEVSGVTGLLVFDGERFCQFLEGRAEHVGPLFERIRVDIRHLKVQLVHESSSDRRSFRRFSMGFAQIESSELLGSLALLSTSEAMSKFWELVPSLDMEP
jgi:hypothetical protein